MATQKTESRAQDAIALLKQDHKTMRELLTKLEEAEGRERQSTLKTIEHELKAYEDRRGHLLPGLPGGRRKGRG